MNYKNNKITNLGLQLRCNKAGGFHTLSVLAVVLDLVDTALAAGTTHVEVICGNASDEGIFYRSDDIDPTSAFTGAMLLPANTRVIWSREYYLGTRVIRQGAGTVFLSIQELMI